MYRRTDQRRLSVCRPFAAALAAALSLGQITVAQDRPDPAADNTVESYLIDRGMREVLAAYLRQKLAAAAPADRVAVAERLGRLYVEQLAANLPNDERKAVEQFSRDLLKLVPEADSAELRLDLSKASYLRVEEIVERDRLKLANPDERQEAERVLRSVAPIFQEIGSKQNRRVESLERKEESGREDDSLKAELAEARRIRSLAMYYSGWSSYYLALLTGQNALALRALEDFGWLLNAPQGKAATPDRVPENLLKFEHVARAAMGCAMACSVRGADNDAIRWLDKIESTPELAKPVSDQLFTRRLVVLSSARRWADIELIVRRKKRSAITTEASTLTPTEARLLAVVCLEAMAETNNRDRRTDVVDALAQVALAELVAQGQVGHVLDLVRRYGTAPIGDDGFVVRYIRALQSYDRAREQHTSSGVSLDQPPTDPGVINKYREAAWVLELAVSSPDAARFADELSKAETMLGLALFYAGEAQKAAQKFQAAAERATDPKAKHDAMWLAILALDRAVEAGGTKEMAAQRDQAATVFLAAFPKSEQAARLLLRRAGSGLLPDEQTVAVLLEIGSNSPLYQPARRQASNLLFRLYRRTPVESRPAAASRFLDAAEEVLRFDAQGAAESGGKVSADAAESAVRAARQIAEVALAQSPPESARAEAAIAIIRQLAETVKIDLAPVNDELTYRQLQIALAESRAQQAEEAISLLRARGGPFAQAADRLMYRSALDLWRSSPTSELAALAVITHGERVIAQLSAAPNALADPVLLAVYNDVAEAALAAYEISRKPEPRDAAIRLDRKLLEAGRPTAASLRRLARLSEEGGDLNTALDAWRRLLSAIDTRDPGWFEARYESLRILAKSEPAKARDLLEQHRVLYPKLGPAPWGDKLRELSESLALPAPLQPDAGQPTPPSTNGGNGSGRGGGGGGGVP